MQRMCILFGKSLIPCSTALLKIRVIHKHKLLVSLDHVACVKHLFTHLHQFSMTTSSNDFLFTYNEGRRKERADVLYNYAVLLTYGVYRTLIVKYYVLVIEKDCLKDLYGKYTTKYFLVHVLSSKNNMVIK